MSSAVARVAALGDNAAARGGGYCALCLRTGAELRLVAPRQLEHLVRQLVLHMPNLTPIASSLTWGARACPWCERRCAGAARVLAALAAAARAHRLVARLDAGVDAATLESQMVEADEGLLSARAPALRSTDVLLIDTQLDVMQLQPEGSRGAPEPPPITAEIETVVIEDDPPPAPAPAPPPLVAMVTPTVAMATPAPARGAAAGPLRVTAGGPRPPARLLPKGHPSATSSKLQSALTNVAPKPVPTNTPLAENNSRNICLTVSEGVVQAVSRNVPQAPAVGPSLLVPAAPPLGPVFPLVAPPVAPAASDQVLMVLPPGAQIVSRLDGVGPKYLLLQQPPPAAPPPPTAAPTAPLPAGPPGLCTVSCDSDDSDDSISLSELLQRRDEYNQNSKPDSNKNKTNSASEKPNFYNTSLMGFITDVKSLSEDTSKTNKTNKTNNSDSVNEQCYITNVKSLSDNGVCGKRSSDVTKPGKKAKGGGVGYEAVDGGREARAPPLNTDRVDWEDKIPMDVISFMDATDPCAKIYQPPPPPPSPPKLQQNTVSAQCKKLPNILKSNSVKVVPNCVTSAQNCVTSAQNCVTSARNCVTSAQNCVTSAQTSVTSAPEGPRPLALISNITSATGEKSVVIDLC